MGSDSFFINNNMTLTIEQMIEGIDSFEEFERRFSDEFLSDGAKIGDYLEKLLWKYDKNAATVSEAAGLNRSYVGNIVRGRNVNPSRDTIIGICLAIGTTVEEVQYLLKYSGHAPLYVRRKRDVSIWFGFMKGKSVVEVDLDLAERGFKTFHKAE